MLEIKYDRMMTSGCCHDSMKFGHPKNFPDARMGPTKTLFNSDKPTHHEK